MKKAATLGEGLKHPLEALGAVFTSPKALDERYSGGAKLSPDFQKYVDSNGGSEANIKAHQNGTLKGKPFVPNSNSAMRTNTHWYDNLFTVAKPSFQSTTAIFSL